MAQFLAINRRAYGRFKETDFTADLLDAEAERVRELYAEGIMREVWAHKSPAGAITVIEAESREAAEAVLASLPLSKVGMLDTELFEIGPYRGFGPRG